MPSIQRAFRNVTLTIPAGSNESDDVGIEPFAFGSLQMPAGFDGTTFAIQVSNQEGDSATFKDIRDKNHAEITDLTWSANEIALLRDEVFNFSRMRIKSDSTETEDRAFEIIIKA